MIRRFLGVLLLLAALLPASGAEPVPSGDVALVTSRALLPAMQRWILYRQSQGYRIHTLVQTPRKAEPSFLSWGDILPEPNDIREQIRALNREHPLGAILIVGDGAPLAGQSPDPNDPLGSALNAIPAPRVPAKVIDRFGYETHIASDNWYADLDGDSFPDVPIGRIPARTPKQAEDAVSKILYYEQVAPPGPWQRRAVLVAGMAGFSMILDNVITSAVRQILASAMPDEYDWTLVQADWRSPYCPDPALFRYTVLDELNQGPLFWVYMGHGLHQELDRLATPKGNYKILELGDLEYVDCRAGLPIMIFCACYTGAYDSTEMSIAEEFVLKPNGPIAAVAASRTSMPYGMGVFGIEFLEEAFRRQSDPGGLTLGEYIFAVKNRMKPFDPPREKGKKEKDGETNETEPSGPEEAAPDPSAAAGEAENAAEDAGEPKPDGDAAEDPRSRLRRTADGLAKTFDPTAKQLGDQLEDHRHLFNLFGDPLLRIRFPERIDFQLPEIGYVDEPVTVSSSAEAQAGGERGAWSAGEGPVSDEPAHVTVELLNLPTRPKIKLENRTDYSDSDEARIEYQRTFEEINDRVLARAECETRDGNWSAELPLPVKQTGTYIVRVMITSPEKTQAGAKRFKIWMK